MPVEVRMARRAEVASDLWDHREDGIEQGVPALVVASHMLLRTCAGVLDDLMWCYEVRDPTQRPRRFTMELSPRQARWTGILSVAGVATGLLLFGIVPTLKSYFGSVGIPLPLPTRVVFGLSAFVTAYWWACAAGAVAVLLATKRWVFAASSGDPRIAADRDALLTRMEPLMIVGLGVVVGAMILAMFLPMFDAVRAMS
jgi:hypothetical protein